jgi:hypothetical protein
VAGALIATDSLPKPPGLLAPAVALGVVSVAIQALGASPNPLPVARTVVGLAWLAYSVTTLALLFGSFARRGFHDTPNRSGVSPAPAARLKLGELVDRCVAVSGVTLVRFLDDPAAHLVSAYWLVVGLLCGYALLESSLGGRFRRTYWIAAVLFLLPWGLGMSPHWPTFQ